MSESQIPAASRKALEMIERLNAGLTSDRRARADHRREERQAFVSECEVCFFIHDLKKAASRPGMTRNLSNHGLGIIVRRPFNENEPIEVLVGVPGCAPTHVAGIVRSSRHVTDGLFEVGIELMSAAETPIFWDGPGRAMRDLPWFAESFPYGQTKGQGAS